MLRKKLIDLREKNNFYQKDIAKILGIKQQTYSLWENGTKIIPLKHLNKLCNYYNVSMDYILGLPSNNSTININKNKELDKNLIGKRIRIIRDKNSLTLRELAEVLNTTSSTISAYETGKNLILTAFAYEICKRYNISMDWLCGRK